MVHDARCSYAFMPGALAVENLAVPYELKHAVGMGQCFKQAGGNQYRPPLHILAYPYKEIEMKSFWLKFKERVAGCVEAKDEAAATAIAKAATGFDAVSIQRLPYPANPRINQHVDPKYGVCPSFCFKPEQCCGNTSCPQRYSCTE
jgi:hypothetical protein